MPYSVSPRVKLDDRRVEAELRTSARGCRCAWPPGSGRARARTRARRARRRKARNVVTSADPQTFNSTSAGDLLRILARPRVHRAHRRQRVAGFAARAHPSSASMTSGNAGKRQPPVEKRVRPRPRWPRSARPAGCRRPSSAAVGQAQARETRLRRAARSRARPARARSSDGSGAGPALGIRERVLNRQPHVGDAELRDRSIRRRSSTIECTTDCGWIDDVDPVGAHAEQPVRLDHLEALVHQRRRVDRDLPAHPPGRMLQRIFGGHAPRVATRGRPRNGPPDAVRIEPPSPRRGRAPCRHW